MEFDPIDTSSSLDAKSRTTLSSAAEILASPPLSSGPARRSFTKLATDVDRFRRFTESGLAWSRA
jgi:hypothetical protein